MKIQIIAFMALILTCSCASEDDNIKDIQNVADDFATSYFNYDFKKSRKYCTEESDKWIRFAASNVDKKDIETLRAQAEGASHSIGEIIVINDTSATACITVHNVLVIDTIGVPGHIENNAEYVIPLVNRNGKWLVKMEGLPQNEKRSHD